MAVAGVYERWHQWDRVAYGPGSAGTLGAELDRLGATRAFLLTTPSVAAAGLADRLGAAAGARLAGTSDACRAHVPQDGVAALAQTVTDARADALIAIGGGSVIDTAKAVALALAPRPTAAALPIVALPTTLSGAELTGVVATTDAAAVKHLHADDRLAPASVLYDPELALATPRRLWLSTGVKTLSDAVEQVCAGRGTPVTEALCTEAISRLAAALPAAAEPDPEARLACQVAAWMALFGLYDGGGSVGLGAALRHQVAVTCGLAHGEVTCVLLPHVLRFNASVLGDRAERVAVALGESPGPGAAERAAAAVERLIASLELPARLGDIAAGRPDMAALAERVVAEPAAGRNPRAITSPSEVKELLEAAW